MKLLIVFIVARNKLKNRVQEIVNSISDEFYKIFSNDGAVLIWFGSWVKGDAYLQSDIDLAIKSDQQLDNKKLSTFRQYLDEFPTLYKVDLVDMRDVGELLKTEIERYGKIL